MKLSTDPDELVRGFCAAWEAKDVERIMAHFATDAVWHNMPMAPIEGTAAIRKTIEGYVGREGSIREGSIRFDILHQIASGNVVMNERVDHLDMSGKKTAARVCGVFEITGGKIARWREYFDPKGTGEA